MACIPDELITPNAINAKDIFIAQTVIVVLLGDMRLRPDAGTNFF